MKDCHGLNILFDGVRPKFVDIGSFTPDTQVGWNAYEQFLTFYYYSLCMWRYNPFVGQLSVYYAHNTPHETYLLYRYPLLRYVSPALVRR